MYPLTLSLFGGSRGGLVGFVGREESVVLRRLPLVVYPTAKFDAFARDSDPRASASKLPASLVAETRRRRYVIGH
jgi:hypothetical protein